MAKQVVNNIKLGVFVLAGLCFLVLLLFMIGKNAHLIGANYKLRARFDNIQGLVVGNNVRYAGIEAGTVKKIEILNDTVIEVTMVLGDKMQPIIHKNAMVSIGTEGVVGNKVVNIFPAHSPGELAQDGDLLVTRKSVDTDEMLQTLDKTNRDIAIIAEELKKTIQRIENNTAMWSLLEDHTLPDHVRSSLSNIHTATNTINDLVGDLQIIVADVKNGKGSIGELLRDSTMVQNLNDALLELKGVGSEADSLVSNIDAMVTDLHQDIMAGKGLVHTMFGDSVTAAQLNTTLDNLQKGTDKFDQNMEALQHNFIFRGYFKKQEKAVEKTPKN